MKYLGILIDKNISWKYHINYISSSSESNPCCVSLPDEPHGPLLLTVEPYQDQASGSPVTELDGKVTWVGTLQLDTPEVQFLCAFLGVPLE